MRMIDTHCHLLPGLDDGPQSVPQAISMARELVSQGVERVVCTPHWSRSFPVTEERVASAASDLCRSLDDHNLELDVVVAAEVSDVFAATRPLDDLRRRSLGETALVVDVSPGLLPASLSAIVRRLVSAGLTPILAHPERCRAVQADPCLVDSLRADGALTQLVAPSLQSSREAVVSTARTLLRTGRIDLLASDAHDSTNRPPALRAAEEYVVTELGREIWNELTWGAPTRLLDAGGGVTKPRTTPVPANGRAPVVPSVSPARTLATRTALG